MSRHTAHTEDYAYAWGYDPPTSAYFFQKFDKNADNGHDALVFSIDSYLSDKPHPDDPQDKLQYRNGEILKIMKDEGVVPKQHLAKLAGDLPF